MVCTGEDNGRSAGMMSVLNPNALKKGDSLKGKHWVLIFYDALALGNPAYRAG
jgi:hypothetical protein